MAYTIEVRSSARRALASLPRYFQERIGAAIAELANDARPHGVKKLTGQGSTFRVRIGAYRIVYEVDDATRRVVVTRIAHRREAYR